MLEHLHEDGVYFLIDADFDVITCPQCRVAVPVAQACKCVMRTKGPSVENQTRKILTKEQDAPERQQCGDGKRPDHLP